MFIKCFSHKENVLYLPYKVLFNYNFMKLRCLLMSVVLLSTFSSVFGQLNSFTLSPSGTTDEFIKYLPKPVEFDGSVYVTGYMTLSGYMNQNSGIYYEPGIPFQKFQMQGGNILLCRTHPTSLLPNTNPTSRNGAILFSDFVTSYNNWTNGKWGIEYDDEFSTGGLNFFKPYSSIADSRINFNLFIKNNGNVGIGTGEPRAKLEVSEGDIFISDINKGIIMKSPDGNCWRGTLTNDGQLTFTQLPDCSTVTVKNSETTTGLVIYPNPAKGYIELTMPIQKQPWVASIFSIKGDLVKTVTLKPSDNRISTENLEPGTYILQLVNSDKAVSERFVIGN